jgi:hypothetical protein
MQRAGEARQRKRDKEEAAWPQGQTTHVWSQNPEDVKRIQEKILL